MVVEDLWVCKNLKNLWSQVDARYLDLSFDFIFVNFCSAKILSLWLEDIKKLRGFFFIIMTERDLIVSTEVNNLDRGQ